MRLTHILGSTCAVVLAAGVTPWPAAATPPQGEVDRTDLAQGTTDAPIAIVAVGQPTTLHVHNVVLGPAASSGWHAHPGPEYTVINDGTVQPQTATSCTPTAFSAGQAIFIPAGVPHIVVNDGAEDAEAVVTYTLPAGRPIRDDTPAACPSGQGPFQYSGSWNRLMIGMRSMIRSRSRGSSGTGGT